LIIAAAHPTPALTVTAFTGQFKAQAPHSMQASFVIRALPSDTSKTLCGQTLAQIPHPIHFSAENRSVDTFFK
jgi:hypothetical protein